VGVTITPICGTFLCGQTLCGTWKATEGRSTLVLKGKSFSILITTPGVIHLNVNRPRLYLLGGTLQIHKDTQLAVGRSKLILKGRAFVIQPFKRVAFTGKPTLLLRGRHFNLQTSTRVQIGRPVLYLRGGELARVGRAGLVPTTPEVRSLTPTVQRVGTLTPTVAQAHELEPTQVAVR